MKDDRAFSPKEYRSLWELSMRGVLSMSIVAKKAATKNQIILTLESPSKKYDPWKLKKNVIDNKWL